MTRDIAVVVGALKTIRESLRRTNEGPHDNNPDHHNDYGSSPTHVCIHGGEIWQAVEVAIPICFELDAEMADLRQQSDSLMYLVNNPMGIADAKASEFTDKEYRNIQERAVKEVKEAYTNGDHFFLGPDCIFCGAFGPNEEQEPCIRTLNIPPKKVT